jgi:signal transduction histidine kinase
MAAMMRGRRGCDIRPEEDPGSPQEDDGAALWHYLRDMSRRAQDALLAAALTVAVELQVFLSSETHGAAVAVVGGLGLTVPIGWRRSAPLAMVAAFAAASILQGALGGGVYNHAPPLHTALVAGVVVFFSLGAYADDRDARIGLGVGLVGYAITIVASGNAAIDNFAWAGGLITLTPWLAGRVLRARMLRAAALERAAASEERQRIARELHDVVAHGVVLMVLQAQGARRILDQDPERARAALEAIEETGQTALAEMRRSLGILREDSERADLAPQPTLDDLDTLIAEMRLAGLQVELDVRGNPRPVADGVDRSAYRIVQEALTNTIKHAGIVPTRVTVVYGAEDLTLEVADDGRGRGTPNPAGHGLAGMRERARLYGGEVHVLSSNGHGFVVRATFPLET